MKLRRNRLLTAIAAAIVLTASFSEMKITASAEEAQMQDSQQFNITLFCEDEGKPLSGMEFSLYLLGTEGKDGRIEPAAAFTEYSPEIRRTARKERPVLASTLEGYIIQDDILPATQGATDGFGRVTLRTPEEPNSSNVYLLTGDLLTVQETVYETAPVILSRTDVQDADSDNFGMYPKFAKRSIDGISRKVTKTWEDNSHEGRPKEVTVHLWKDGRKCDTVILNAGNRWSHQWSGLDGSSAWKITEVRAKDYAVSIELEGSEFSIVNTFTGKDTPKESKPTGKGEKLPQSGLLWWPVPILLMFGTLLIWLGCRMRKREEHE